MAYLSYNFSEWTGETHKKISADILFEIQESNVKYFEYKSGVPMLHHNAHQQSVSRVRLAKEGGSQKNVWDSVLLYSHVGSKHAIRIVKTFWCTSR